ncbi:hypothetical protein BOTBODRAFT_44231 [Botryobasidium botryosum FD-172 SS1]|uniref:Uncharacterized protein n=1 Tax=Botryobasidium botryosum (strain FD-172 SS1) TaxID=930990 RepID=A0A067MU22_BOTB1|nr:hypothetical protein BOTBODRAFT_44231 [Botryobasidium botryosum FD-172 SS1]
MTGQRETHGSHAEKLSGYRRCSESTRVPALREAGAGLGVRAASRIWGYVITSDLEGDGFDEREREKLISRPGPGEGQGRACPNQSWSLNVKLGRFGLVPCSAAAGPPSEANEPIFSWRFISVHGAAAGRGNTFDRRNIRRGRFEDGGDKRREAKAAQKYRVSRCNHGQLRPPLPSHPRYASMAMAKTTATTRKHAAMASEQTAGARRVHMRLLGTRAPIKRVKSDLGRAKKNRDFSAAGAVSSSSSNRMRQQGTGEKQRKKKATEGRWARQEGEGAKDEVWVRGRGAASLAHYLNVRDIVTLAPAPSPPPSLRNPRPPPSAHPPRPPHARPRRRQHTPPAMATVQSMGSSSAIRHPTYPISSHALPPFLQPQRPRSIANTPLAPPLQPTTSRRKRVLPGYWTTQTVNLGTVDIDYLVRTAVPSRIPTYPISPSSSRAPRSATSRASPNSHELDIDLLLRQLPLSIPSRPRPPLPLYHPSSLRPTPPVAPTTPPAEKSQTPPPAATTSDSRRQSSRSRKPAAKTLDASAKERSPRRKRKAAGASADDATADGTPAAGDAEERPRASKRTRRSEPAADPSTSALSGSEPSTSRHQPTPSPLSKELVLADPEPELKPRPRPRYGNARRNSSASAPDTATVNGASAGTPSPSSSPTAVSTSSRAGSLPKESNTAEELGVGSTTPPARKATRRRTKVEKGDSKE